jgi:hypothetical protein
MKHQPLTKYECDRDVAEYREWWRSLDAVPSGQFQLGRLMTLSYNLSKGHPCNGLTHDDLSDIGGLAYQFLEYLMMNAHEVDAMDAEDKGV